MAFFNEVAVRKGHILLNGYFKEYLWVEEHLGSLGSGVDKEGRLFQIGGNWLLLLLLLLLEPYLYYSPLSGTQPFPI